MLTINPSINSNNYVNTFKAKANYQQIYNEMERITIQSEEKILKKTNIGDNFKSLKNNLKDFFSQTNETCRIFAIGAGALVTVFVVGFSHAMVGLAKCGTDGCVKPEQYYQQGKIDALRKLYHEKVISHDVFMKYMNEMNN